MSLPLLARLASPESGARRERKSALRARRARRFSVLAISSILLPLLLGFSCREEAPGDAPAKDQPVQRFPVSAVEGPSWLHRIGLGMSETRMGEMGGEGPIVPTPRREPNLAPTGLRAQIERYFSAFGKNQNAASEALNEPFVLAGADLYRLSCQSCHGPDGKGAPPEIGSLIGPVQGTSVKLALDQMKARGTPIPKEMAEQLAGEAEAELRRRIEHGGEKMPPFEHLQGEEVDALIQYLGKLAKVPETEPSNLMVTETIARVGEHLIKGTCHICHDATGPGGGHMAMMRGIVPSLASFVGEQSLSTVIRQVEYGSPEMMGMMMGAQRMPAMPYLTEEEVAAGYLYLADYPPKP